MCSAGHAGRFRERVARFRRASSGGLGGIGFNRRKREKNVKKKVVIPLSERRDLGRNDSVASVGRVRRLWWLKSQDFPHPS